MNRFSNFKNITSLKFPTLSNNLTLESFIALDDYVCTFLFRFTQSLFSNALKKLKSTSIELLIDNLTPNWCEVIIILYRKS